MSKDTEKIGLFGAAPRPQSDNSPGPRFCRAGGQRLNAVV